MTADILHKPVLLKEIIEALELAPGKVIVDCTVGLGGHAEAILNMIVPAGRLIGIDKDTEALKRTQERLERFKDAITLVHSSFDDLKTIFERLKIEKTDGFLFDLGVSSLQLDDLNRGFSFRGDAPLDMRMDKESSVSASDIVNASGEAELAWILENYGEEKFSRRIAKSIVSERKAAPIMTTGKLVEAILRAVPYKFRHGRVHVATRTFQALRIAVNKELSVLENAIDEAIGLLKPRGIICVASYHSLEDRIIKNKFKEAKANGVLELINKKPLIPSDEEMAENPRARSAKLRIARKT